MNVSYNWHAKLDAVHWQLKKLENSDDEIKLRLNMERKTVEQEMSKLQIQQLLIEKREGLFCNLDIYAGMISDLKRRFKQKPKEVS